MFDATCQLIEQTSVKIELESKVIELKSKQIEQKVATLNNVEGNLPKIESSHRQVYMMKKQLAWDREKMSAEKIQLALDHLELEILENDREVQGRGTKEEMLNEHFKIAQKRSTLVCIPPPKFLAFENIFVPDWGNRSLALIERLDNCNTKITIPMNWGGGFTHFGHD